MRRIVRAVFLAGLFRSISKERRRRRSGRECVQLVFFLSFFPFAFKKAQTHVRDTEMACNCRLGIKPCRDVCLRGGLLLLLQYAGTDDFGKERKGFFSQRSKLHT